MASRVRLSRAGSMLVAALLGGCASRGAAVPVTAPAGASQSARSAARFVITVPKPATESAIARRTPRYVSPATQSLIVTVTNHATGASVLSEAANLTPTSQGCTSTLASTLCVLNVSLPPGTYDATISTYDATQAATTPAPAVPAGAELSSGQDIDFTIVAGTTNAITLTLSGIPVSLAVASGAYAVHGSQSSGFTLYGLSAQPLRIEALDADGNTIVGPGSPSFSVAATSGSVFTIAQPQASAPNTFTLAPPANGANGQSQTLRATAAYPDGTCSSAGAVCTTSFTVRNDVQTLFVANGFTTTAGEVTIFTAPYTAAPEVVTQSRAPSSLQLLPDADLAFVQPTDVSITESPFTDTADRIDSVTNGVNSPTAIAVSPSGDLFVYNNGTLGVNEYAPPYGNAPLATFPATNGSPPGEDPNSALAFDRAGDLFVGIQTPKAEILEYTPGSARQTSPVATFPIDAKQLPVVSFIAIDAGGDLFAPSPSGIAEFTAPLADGSPPEVTIPDAQTPILATLDGYGDLFVVNAGNGTVAEYAPPFSSASVPVATIANGLDAPRSLAFDGLGDLFVGGEGSTIAEYAPPFTNASAPIATLPAIGNANGQYFTESLLFTP